MQNSAAAKRRLHLLRGGLDDYDNVPAYSVIFPLHEYV